MEREQFVRPETSKKFISGRSLRWGSRFIQASLMVALSYLAQPLALSINEIVNDGDEINTFELLLKCEKEGIYTVRTGGEL